MTKKKNFEKYYSYTAAYAKMTAAIKQGFYLEAITIQESIITDRLLSFVVQSKLLQISSDKMYAQSLSKLIKLAKPYFESDTILVNLEKFRKNRNYCMHSFVKSFPGKPTITVKDFEALSKKTAKEGKKVTREIDTWRKKMKKQFSA